MTEESVFSPPRDVTDIADCYFYHVMDLPGYGEVGGEWDLRGGEDSYLGQVSFAGKRILELGTASGHLCRYMERQGAEVIGFDLSVDRFWDFVPFAGYDVDSELIRMREHIEKLKNGWWFTHRVFGSNAKAVYGNIYDIPDRIGAVDIATFGSILLHLRDPFQALHSALRLTRETVIVTEVHPNQGPASSESSSGYLDRLRQYFGFRRHIIKVLTKAKVIPPPVRQSPDALFFLPDPNASDLRMQLGSWWCFPPQVICRFLDVLGFGDQVVTEHFQNYLGKPVRLYTVVAKRTVGQIEKPTSSVAGRH
jgi:hypothetical protein